MVSLTDSPQWSHCITEESPRHEDGQVCESGEDNARLQLALFRLARDLRDFFIKTANKLDRHHKNVNIVRVTGGSVSSIATVVAIGSGIAIPFTSGISIILAIVGGAVAATGGVTAGGAGIFKYIIDRKALKEAEKKWSIFCKMYVKVHHLQKQNLNNNPAADGVKTAAGLGAAGAASLGLVARETLVAAGGVGGRTAATAARLAAATAGVTVLVNVILLGFSLYDIIDGSLELHRARKSPAGDIMRKMAKELEDHTEMDESLMTGDLLDLDLLIDDRDLRLEWY